MKKSLAITLFILLAETIYGQNVIPPHMYLMNQTMINPAYAGIHDHANVTLISRGQWIGVDGAPFTHTLVGSSTFSYHSAIGFSLVKDSYGINSDTEINLQYSYRIEMHNSALSFGLQGGTMFSSEDPSKLNIEVSDDPLVGSGRFTSTTPSFGFGMMYKSKRLYLGVGMPRITGSKVEIEEIYTKGVSPVYNLTGGLFIKLTNGLLIKPSFLLNYQDEELLADINGQLLIGEKVWLGLSVRNLKRAGFNFLYSEEGKYHFGYSYQFPLNELEASSYGTHELMLSFDIKLTRRQELENRLF